ncbi:hypothetical protein ACRRTK_008597 [Alexandromys fortis]
MTKPALSSYVFVVFSHVTIEKALGKLVSLVWGENWVWEPSELYPPTKEDTYYM